mgnify:CR=1 FL=1
MLMFYLVFVTFAILLAARWGRKRKLSMPLTAEEVLHYARANENKEERRFEKTKTKLRKRINYAVRKNRFGKSIVPLPWVSADFIPRRIKDEFQKAALELRPEYQELGIDLYVYTGWNSLEKPWVKINKMV